jgi:glycine cleavage system H protein
VSEVPDDRKYTQTHEWLLAEGHVVTIGITQYAADELTDITYVELPETGTEVTAGRAMGEIESVKATSDIVAHVSGKVIEINEALADEPGLVNTDPFGRGWMVKLQADDLSPLEGLMDASAYTALLHEG